MSSDERTERREGSPEDREEGFQGLVPDLLRRILALGFSGFFLTEGALRKALGDTLPQEWMDFAVDQSERTRNEFLERLAVEIARSAEAVDLGSLADRLLEGHTIEVKAQIRFRSSKGKKPTKKLDFKLAGGETHR
jgi:hypothetical protein